MWQRLSALPILAFIVLVEPLQALAQSLPNSLPSRGYGPWHMWSDGYGPFWWGGPIIMILFWVLVITGIVAIVMFFVRGRPQGPDARGGASWQSGERPWADPTLSALQILSERFARGEIQKDEYEDKKAAIVSGTRR